jgi:hypothetical protein
MVIAPPNGDLLDEEIAPVEVLMTDDGMFLRLVLEDGDIERLQDGKPIWLCLRTKHLPVFSIGVEGDD